MIQSPPSHPAHEQPKAWLYIGRALRLRCPECGISPVFTPWRRVRSLFDWFTPLDGCPLCGYAYAREQGYFLLAIWGVNYGLVAGLGVLTGLAADILFHPPFTLIVLCVLAVMPVFSFLFARHAKSLFLAMDHY